MHDPSRHNLDSFIQRILFPSLASVFILSAFASPDLANLSSSAESHALVKALSLAFNTFLWHGRLGSHDHAVPWPLTKKKKKGPNNSPFRLYWHEHKHCSPAKCVLSVWKQKKKLAGVYILWHICLLGKSTGTIFDFKLLRLAAKTKGHVPTAPKSS